MLIHLYIMKLYRGICNLLFKQIDPYFKGNGKFNSFGEGTSYAVDFEVGKMYAKGCSGDAFGFVLEYIASGINHFEVTPSDFLKQSDNDFMENGFYKLKIDGKRITSNKLSEMIEKKGYNSILINESDSITTGKQLLILNENIILELESILFSINYPLGDFFDEDFIKLELKMVEENLYEVPLSKILKLDEILNEYCV